MKNTVQALVCAILTLSFMPSASAQNKESEPTLFPEGTEVQVGRRDIADPLFLYKSLVDESFAASSPIKQTSGCDRLEVWQPVLVTNEHWRTVEGPIPSGVSEVGVLAIAAASNCVKVGHPMRITALRMPAGIAVDLGWFFPTSIVGRRPQYATFEESLMFSAKLTGSQEEVVFVSGRVIEGTSSVSKTLAPRMAGARFINRDQMEESIKNGTQVIDVRSKLAYTRFRIKGSVNIPYSTGPRMKLFEEYTDYPKSGDAFDIRKVQPDRDKPVVIVGGSRTEAVYRAAVVLRSEGWKKIFVFGEGIGYFAGLNFTPPAVSTLVKVVDIFEVNKMISDRALNVAIIDARRPVSFAQGTMPNAYLATYYEREDMPLRVPGLNGKMLIEYGEDWILPVGLNTSSPVIVFGMHERDWRGYKAALSAKASGFANVYWYRGGMGEWLTYNNLDRGRFGVVFHQFPLPKGFTGGPKK